MSKFPACVDTPTAQALKEQYSIICELLDLKNPPYFRVVALEQMPTGVGGQHFKSEVRIGDQPPSIYTDIVTIHELVHEVLVRAKYRSYGHAGPFLAVFLLLLAKTKHWDDLAVLDEIIHESAHINWPVEINFCIWRLLSLENYIHGHRDKHLKLALDLSKKFINEQGDLDAWSPEGIARWVLENWPRPERVPYGFLGNLILFSVWHTLISERRGWWFIQLWLARMLVFIGFAICVISSRTGYPSAALIGLGNVFLGLLLSSMVTYWRKRAGDCGVEEREKALQSPPLCAHAKVAGWTFFVIWMCASVLFIRLRTPYPMQFYILATIAAFCYLPWMAHRFKQWRLKKA